MAKKKLMPKPPRRLSQLYGFDPAKVDFIDLDLNDDLVLFVDPLLFWRSPHREHHIVHAKIIQFFEHAIDQINAGNAELIKRSFVFPEPENLLGVSRSGHGGHGMGALLGGRLFDGLVNNQDILANGLTFINELQLVIEDVGPDLISDMSVNIAKEFFVKFTQENCRLHNIPLERCTTDFFLEEEGIWDQCVVELPLNPDTNEPFLLTPRIVVRRKDLALNYKEIYQSHLRDIFKVNVDQHYAGIAKPPKVTWKLVKEHYPDNKSIVAEAINGDPQLRKKIVDSIDVDIQSRGLETTIDTFKIINPNGQVTVTALKEIFSAVHEDTELKSEIEKIIQNHLSIDLLLISDINALLGRTIEDLVVILGSYNVEQEDPFDSIKGSLESEEYEPCIIKDMPDIGHTNPRQKLLTYAILSRFLVVLDFGPSGHLNEIELLKDLAKPVIIISKDKKGSSYMTQGLTFSNTYYERFTLDDHGDLTSCLMAGIEWANKLISTVVSNNRAELPWMTPEIDIIIDPQ